MPASVSPRLRRLLGGLVGACVVSGWLWWLDHRGSDGGDSPTPRLAQGTAPRTAARPELPTRTSQRPGDPEPAPSAVGSCALEAFDHRGMPVDELPLPKVSRFGWLTAERKVEDLRVLFPGDGTLALTPELLAALTEGPLLLVSALGDTLSVEPGPGGCSRAVLALALRVELACPLEPGWDAGAELLRLRIDGSMVPFEVDGSALRFSAPSSDGQALAELRDGAELLVRWSGERCEPINPEALLATVEVTVVDRRLDPRIWLVGCGMRPRRVVANVSTELDISPEPCLLEAWRTDGALRALAEPVYIDPLPGDYIPVTLTLPEHRMAGMGIAFRLDEGAAEVRGVRPGTPAWEAGLRQGDRIVTVDGEDVEGMTDNDFIAFGTGPEGSVVELLLEDEDGELRELALERSLIQR